MSTPPCSIAGAYFPSDCDIILQMYFQYASERLRSRNATSRDARVQDGVGYPVRSASCITSAITSTARSMTAGSAAVKFMRNVERASAGSSPPSGVA